MTGPWKKSLCSKSRTKWRRFYSTEKSMTIGADFFHSFFFLSADPLRKICCGSATCEHTLTVCPHIDYRGQQSIHLSSKSMQTPITSKSVHTAPLANTPTVYLLLMHTEAGIDHCLQLYPCVTFLLPGAAQQLTIRQFSIQFKEGVPISTGFTASRRTPLYIGQWGLMDTQCTLQPSDV